MERYVRVCGQELRVGDVVYHKPGTEECGKLRVEEIDNISNTISMLALNQKATEQFIKPVFNDCHNFFINYETVLYKEVAPPSQPTKQIKEFKLC